MSEGGPKAVLYPSLEAHEGARYSFEDPHRAPLRLLRWVRAPAPQPAQSKAPCGEEVDLNRYARGNVEVFEVKEPRAESMAALVAETVCWAHSRARASAVIAGTECGPARPALKGQTRGFQRAVKVTEFRQSPLPSDPEGEEKAPLVELNDPWLPPTARGYVAGEYLVRRVPLSQDWSPLTYLATSAFDR